MSDTINKTNPEFASQADLIIQSILSTKTIYLAICGRDGSQANFNSEEEAYKIYKDLEKHFIEKELNKRNSQEEFCIFDII